nr:type I-MYXAN CRISPR-associated protein Cas6/Cmx6 [Deltaproteobacteria bacterium]
MIQAPARVDVAFSLTGERVPAEHGYALFAAMCRIIDDLHGASWLSVHPIPGEPNSDGTLTLRPDELALRLRVDPAYIDRVLPMAGATLSIEGYVVTVGTSRVLPLEPVAELGAWMVALKDRAYRQEFEAYLRRRLDVVGVRAAVEIPAPMGAAAGEHTDGRRVLHIRQQTIVGYPVILRGLSAEDSLRVQGLGIGGRQRFGCGVFAPMRSTG